MVNLHQMLPEYCPYYHHLNLVGMRLLQFLFQDLSSLSVVVNNNNVHNVSLFFNVGILFSHSIFTPSGTLSVASHPLGCLLSSL